VNQGEQRGRRRRPPGRQGGQGESEGDEPQGGPSPWSYAGIGFELVVPILLGVFAGNWLDSRWGTRPWLLVVGSLLGIVVGFYSFLRRVIPMGRADR